jgi:hypothetical protein
MTAKARPFFGAYQTRQAQAGIAARPDQTIFKSFANTPASAIAALAVNPASSRTEDLAPNKRSKQFPGLAKP